MTAESVLGGATVVLAVATLVLAGVTYSGTKSQIRAAQVDRKLSLRPIVIVEVTAPGSGIPTSLRLLNAGRGPAIGAMYIAEFQGDWYTTSPVTLSAGERTAPLPVSRGNKPGFSHKKPEQVLVESVIANDEFGDVLWFGRPSWSPVVSEGVAYAPDLKGGTITRLGPK